jgi:hypothetical protein
MWSAVLEESPHRCQDIFLNNFLSGDLNHGSRGLGGFRTKCFGARRCSAAFQEAFSNRKSLSSGAYLITLLAHETHEMTRKEEIMELIYKDESYAIIGACFEVYKDKGCGFHEPIYHECLEIELEFQGIPFLSKPPQTL